MTVNKNLDGATLTVEIIGRLDTTTAPKLEAELKTSIDGINKLVLDFAQLEYISSAGLRVLLKSQKTMMKQVSAGLIFQKALLWAMKFIFCR